MPDAWLLGLVPTLLLGLLASLQQVSAPVVTLYFQGPTLLGQGSASGAGSPPPLLGFPRDHAQLATSFLTLLGRWGWGQRREDLKRPGFLHPGETVVTLAMSTTI